MKKFLKVTALLAALAVCGTMALAGCDTESDMSDDDLADLKTAAAATCAYSGSYGYSSTYKLVMSGTEDGVTESITSDSADKFTYDSASGSMGYYSEQTYGISSSLYSFSDTAADGDYIIPDGSAYSEYIYSKATDLDDVVTITTLRYDYDSLTALESSYRGTINYSYSDYKQLGNMLDDIAQLDLSGLTEINSVEEIKTSITEDLQGELAYDVSVDSLTADCLAGEEDGSQYYTIKASGSFTADGETATMSVAITYYTDGGYITKVATTVDMRYKESESAEETVITADGVYYISYSYDSSVIPSETELAGYAKQN